jgi:hypothetical protein
MKFQNTWYLIERDNHFETISHEILVQLPEGSFAIRQNFETRHEALEEHKRLVMLAISDIKHRLEE